MYLLTVIITPHMKLSLLAYEQLKMLDIILILPIMIYIKHMNQSCSVLYID